jgi:hypothetical protein
MDKNEARAALDAAQDATSSLVETARAACPPWRHAAFALVMALLVLSTGLPLPWRLALFLTGMIGTGWLAAWDRRRSGIFVNGFRRGATRPVALALLGMMLVLVFAEAHAHAANLSLATRLGLAVIALAFAGLASMRFQQIYLRELQEGLVP